MNKISATIIKDSINPQGNRLTTFELIFPRYILAELNTHRVFSKNSASSRAIPFNKMVKSVQDNPFIPIAFQKHHKGMQGNEYFTDPKEIEELQNLWLKSRDKAVEEATTLYNAGVTKQLCNRLLEPFMWHSVILTGTDFENFFRLRCPSYEIDLPISNDRNEDWQTFKFKSKKDLKKEVYSDEIANYDDLEWLGINKGQSEIHMMDLAEKMYDAYQENKPVELKEFEWHSPYEDNILSLNDYMDFIGEPRDKKYSYREEYSLWRLKISVARCARLSYQTIGDNPKIDYFKDLELYNTLLDSKHWSPFEHVALCSKEGNYANFKGFKQLRSLLDK